MAPRVLGAGAACHSPPCILRLGQRFGLISACAFAETAQPVAAKSAPPEMRGRGPCALGVGFVFPPSPPAPPLRRAPLHLASAPYIVSESRSAVQTACVPAPAAIAFSYSVKL